MTSAPDPRTQCAARHLVVVGHGMVGHRFVEALRARDTDGAWRITVLAEEADAAYDRVGLTSYTESWDRSLLALPGNDYPGDDRVRLLLNARVTEIDRATKSVVTADGARHGYDVLILATGSYAFVPPRCPDTTCPPATSTARWTTSTRSAPPPSSPVTTVTMPPVW